MTVRSATRSTTMSRRSAGSGNTSRASQLPYGSCCQLMKCFDGETESEYPSTGVRVCGAGRNLTSCGATLMRRSKRYEVRWWRATLMDIWLRPKMKGVHCSADSRKPEGAFHFRPRMPAEIRWQSHANFCG